MGGYDFTYEFPSDFRNRLQQLLSQLYHDDSLSDAFNRCECDYEDVGLAFYAGMRGDNWDKHAVDFTIEGPRECVATVNDNRMIVKNAISKALKSSKTGLLIRDLVCLESDYASARTSTDEERLNADIATAEEVLDSIVDIGCKLAANSLYTGESAEDNINDYLRDMLEAKGYDEAKDQTRHGLSGSGKSAGEVDILIAKSGDRIALIECLKLNCVDKSNIGAHITKAISNYNPLGLATFVIAYVHSTSFEDFWVRYTAYLREYDFQLEVKKCLDIRAAKNAATRIAWAVLSRDGFDFPVYFVAFKLLD